MLRNLTLALGLLVSTVASADPVDDHDACACNATAAACDVGCACDDECSVDWTVDECSLPGAGCVAELDDATLAADEVAPVVADPLVWTVSDVVCADGATAVSGTCVPEATVGPATVEGGCAATGATGWLVGLGVLGLIVIVRRRRVSLALVLAAGCVADVTTWDQAVDAGPDGDTTSRVDVFSADLGDGDAVQYLLAGQALGASAQQPVAQFALSRSRSAVPILRVATRCGDQLTNATGDGTELLGWASGGGGGTAELVELAAPDGCTHVYETDGDAIAGLVADGYTISGSLGFVWPPGLGELAPSDDAPLVMPATACHVTRQSPWYLLYASPGADQSEQFLTGCPGEVIIGEKREAGPEGRMRLPANQALGGRSAFVLDRNGDKLRELLARSNGVERTAAYLRAKLASGYDYIVVDEITGAADWADGESLNVKFRKLIQRMPARTIIGYISIDLTQYGTGEVKMRDRKLLLRALKQRGRGLALEIYLHTAQVMAGAAPGVFSATANRLARAVKGLANGGGINTRAISVIGTSMHSSYPQYRYLDEPSHDLASITRQVNAIRHASKRTRQQRGVGYYFVGKSDMDPPSAYSYAQLIARMRGQTLRFK